MNFHSFARSALRLSVPFIALVGLTGTARAEWFRAETDHFIIYSEDERAPTETFARDLERFDNALRVLQNLPITPPKPLTEANKVTIFRTGTPRNMELLLDAPGSGVGGFYIGRAGASVGFTPVRDGLRDIRSFRARASDPRTELDPKTILQHEYVHHFMLHNFPATYPDWYVEAFAELYATIALNDDGSFHVGNPPQYRSFAIYNLPDTPLAQLFDQNDRRSSLQQFQFYAFGWLVAHYLNFAPERQGQLATYLKALGQGVDGLTAARTAFGDLGKLTSEIRAYRSGARQGKLPGINVKPPAYAVPAVEVTAVSEAVESVLDEHMRLKIGASKGDARGLANSLASDAARFGDNAFVQTVAAQANLSARRFDEADAAADRALALEPNSIEALLVKGNIAIERGRAGDKAQFANARPFLAKATQIDPTDPRPFIDYYWSFDRAGETPPEDALIGLEQAFDYSGSDPNYRIILARQLLIENKTAAAKTVLAPITFRFHGDQEDNKFRPVVELIDAGKPAEARAKIDALIKEYLDEADED